MNDPVGAPGGERMARLSLALTTVAVPLRKTCIIMPISPVLVGVFLVASWTPAEHPGVLGFSIARSEVWLPPVVIAIAVVGGTTVPAVRGASVPLVVARVVVARVEIEHATSGACC